MKKHETKKGFTLIELLIVIAIIAILAVAFLPTLLGAPAKGRDTARIADLQKVQKVLVNANLEGSVYPNTSGVIADTLATGSGVAATDTWIEAYGTSFGGVLPKDPTKGKNFYYKYQPAGYSFGLWAEVEILTNGNANCDKANNTITIAVAAAVNGNIVPCYAILTQ